MSDRGERIGSGAWSALAIHATVYVAVNGLLIACWVLFGGGSASQLPTVLTSLDAARAQGFWPLYVMVFWGAGLLIHLGVVVATAPGRHRRRKQRRREQRRRAQVQATVVGALPDGVLTDAALAGIRLTDGDKAARRVERASGSGKRTGSRSGRSSSDHRDRGGDRRADRPVSAPRGSDDPTPPPAPVSPAAGGAEPVTDQAPVRRWVAVLFTDVVESTSLNQRLGDDAWAELLTDHRRVVRAAVTAHGGVGVGTQGDGFLLRFGSPEAAVRCAAALQGELTSSGPDRDDVLAVRMGVHAGEVVHQDGDDVVGEVVRLAARVTDSAGPGEILVTEPVADHLPDDLVLVDRGLRQLKGFDRPRHLLAVVWQPGADHIELAEDPTQLGRAT